MAEGIKKISENLIIENRALVVTNKTVADNRAISIGALWSDPSTKSLKIKIGQNTFSYFDASKILIGGSINSSLLADKSVTEIKLADNAVSERVIASNAVTSIKIKNSSITESKIQNNAVTSSKIKDESILSRHLADNSVIGSKILNKTITSEKIADNTLVNINYATASVDGRVLAPNSILSKHFSKKCVTSDALADNSVYGKIIKAAGVESTHLANNSVVTRVIANGAVTSDKIADNAIKNKHLSSSCVENKNLAPSSVNEKNIIEKAISTSKIQDKSITKEKLADNVVTLIGDPVQYDSNNNVTLRNDLEVNGNVNVVGNLRANKVFNAVFMDLAEAYEPEEDTVCIPGDIMQVNENGKLVKASPSSHFPIVGVVSDEYAACYGAEEDELLLGDKVAVGLIGKVHVNVVGPVNLGDKIAVAKDGAGASFNTNNLLEDHIIGKALESSDEIGLKKILCLIYPR